MRIACIAAAIHHHHVDPIRVLYVAQDTGSHVCAHVPDNSFLMEEAKELGFIMGLDLAQGKSYIYIGLRKTLSRFAGPALLLALLLSGGSCSTGAREISQEDENAVLAEALLYAIQEKNVPGFRILETYEDIAFRKHREDLAEKLAVLRTTLDIVVLTPEEIEDRAKGGGSFLYLWTECCEVNDTEQEVEVVVGTSWVVSPDDKAIRLSGGMLILRYARENGEWRLANAVVVEA